MKKRKPKHHIHPKLQDQAVWMSLAAVFLLFYIAFISFSDHPNLTGSAVQNIAFVKAGNQLDFGVNEIPGLEQYRFQVTATIKNGQMRVEPDEAIAFDRPYYSKFRISSPDEDKIGTVQLLLKLEQQTLLGKGISKGDVRVFLDGGAVETTFAKEEGRYFYYTATAPGIGEFVIGKTASKMEEATAEPAGMEEAVVPGEQEPARITMSIPTEEPAAPLVGQAAAEPEAETGFWSSISKFFERLFG